MTKEAINQYYQKIYSKYPNLANTEAEQKIRDYIESYFQIKK